MYFSIYIPHHATLTRETKRTNKQKFQQTNKTDLEDAGTGPFRAYFPSRSPAASLDPQATAEGEQHCGFSKAVQLTTTVPLTNAGCEASHVMQSSCGTQQYGIYQTAPGVSGARGAGCVCTIRHAMATNHWPSIPDSTWRSEICRVFTGQAAFQQRGGGVGGGLRVVGVGRDSGLGAACCLCVVTCTQNIAPVIRVQ